MTRKGKWLLTIFIVCLFAAGLIFLFFKAHTRLKPPVPKKAPTTVPPARKLPPSTKLPTLEKAGSSTLNINFDATAWAPTGKDYELILHRGYSLGYDEKHEQAAWVMYLLNPPIPGAPRHRRKDDFREDPLVSSASASPKDYVNSGYDRGHLAPAADLSYDAIVLSESFYMSNMSPQRAGFNRGVWNALENQVRDWAAKNESLLIITGPVFGKRPRKIGSNRVSVPKAYYKILFDYSGDEVKMIAFLLENRAGKYGFANAAVSVDSVEQLIGLDFFSPLPDSLESHLERQAAIDDWE